VRSRVAAGLGVPALVLRSGLSGRGLLAPLGTLLAAGAASVALVLPAVDLPRPQPAPAAVAAPLTRSAAAIPRQRQAAPRRITRVRVAKQPVSHPRPRPSVTRRSSSRAPAITTHPSARSAAGLGPCRAAQLCQ
jgi:hypothetical protein